MVDKIILVDNNTNRINTIRQGIKDASLTDNVSITLNGGHALLYLHQINDKIKDAKTLILMNMHTPMENGFELLEGYKEPRQLKKENILIAVMEDNLNKQEIEKVEKWVLPIFSH